MGPGPPPRLGAGTKSRKKGWSWDQAETLVTHRGQELGPKSLCPDSGIDRSFWVWPSLCGIGKIIGGRAAGGSAGIAGVSTFSHVFPTFPSPHCSSPHVTEDPKWSWTLGLPERQV